MKSYLDLTVVISPGTDGAYAVRVVTSKGNVGNSTLRLPFALRDLTGVVFGVAQTTRTVTAVSPHESAAGGGSALDSRSATDFGVELFEALFQGEARDMLAVTDGIAESQDAGVRIRLSMDLRGDGMAEVASLPWELMCRRGQRALAVSTQTLLVRSLDSTQPNDPRPFRAPLRILLLESNPNGTASLNLDKERARIEQNWARLPGVQVDRVRPIKADILRALAGADYHVIHYMGHGDFDADEGGMLLLELEDGSPDPVSGDVFAAWLEAEPLRLVFLNACKTGTTSARSGVHPFAGVATALIRERVPAVVAMQFPISDKAAIEFARAFYERISQGYPVDAAVAEGRKVLYSSKPTEWATPVLYLRSKDGHLFGPVNDGATVAGTTPVGLAHGSGTPPTSADDPWGPDAGGAFRVFLATPDQNLEKKHGQLAKALRDLGWVRVVDSVPRDDLQKHAATVDTLVRRADLSVHLLGANPGQRLDDDDPPDTLSTFQLEQLRIGLEADRPQLVVMTSEDKDSIGNQGYQARVDELARLPRDRARFELVITDKNRITETVVAKLQKLRDARQASAAPKSLGDATRAAFVEAHVKDSDPAIALVEYLETRKVKTGMRTSDRESAGDIRRLDEAVTKSPLYIIMAGNVNSEWVTNRKIAAQRSAAKSGASLLIALYGAAAGEAGTDPAVTRSRLEIVAEMNDSEPGWVDELFAPFKKDHA